jgi:hypothetical protein
MRQSTELILGYLNQQKEVKAVVDLNKPPPSDGYPCGGPDHCGDHFLALTLFIMPSN